MSIVVRVEEWLRKMGHGGEVPASLSIICHPSTTFIWEQLISNVKPRNEVNHVKKNIIVKRLTQKPLDKQDRFDYSIKEIEIYMERQKLEKRIRYLENNIEEKEEAINDILKQNKTLYVTIDTMKAKIREMQESKYLLNKRSKVIEEDVEQVQEVLTLARNLTPVEMDENANGDEVTKTLQKCVEKLQRLADGISLPKTTKTKNLYTSVKKKSMISKYSSKTYTFSRYLNQSSALTEILSASKRNIKENINFPKQNNIVNRCLNFTSTDELNENTKKPNRESLGLLPDDCFNTSDDLDLFLLTEDDSEDSILQPLSDCISETSNPTKTNYEFIEKLIDDKKVNEALKNLLHHNNRHLILTQWKILFENLLTEIRNSSNKFKHIRSNKVISQKDWTELYFIHIKNELNKEKYQATLRKLQEVTKKKKEEIFFQLCNRVRNKDEVRRIFDVQIEEAFLTGANNFLSQEINSSKKLEHNNDLQLINVKIKKIKEECANQIDWIQKITSDIYKVLENIRNNREETLLCVRKLYPLIRDLSWASPMKKNIVSQEVETFKHFPIEYNRKIKANQSKISCRNLSTTSVPPYIELNSNNQEMLTILMDAPFSTPEIVIFNALQTKFTSNKLQVLQSQLEISDSNDYTTYSLKELTKQEEYLEPAMNKLSSIINSSAVRDVLSASEYMKEVRDLWLEMPFKNYISEKKLVNGRNYKFYEKALKELI